MFLKKCDTYIMDYTLYTNPPFQESQSRYGPGFNIFSKFCYGGKGHGHNEQGIKVPLEANPRNFKIGIGYCATKSKVKPWLNFNMISIESPLKLIHLEYIESKVDSKEVHLDVFSLNEALEDFLGSYSNLPFHQHK